MWTSVTTMARWPSLPSIIHSPAPATLSQRNSSTNSHYGTAQNSHSKISTQLNHLNDFKTVGNRTAHNDSCPDYSILLSRVKTWLDPTTSSHFSLSDISNLSPPNWLLDQLICGGLSSNGSFDMAKGITHEFRLACIANWQSRTPPQTEHKRFASPEYDVAPPYVSSIWGKGTTGSSNAIPTKPGPLPHPCLPQRVQQPLSA